MATTPAQYKELFERLLESRLSPEDSSRIIAWLGGEEHDPGSAKLILEQLESSDVYLDDQVRESLERRLATILESDQEPLPRIPFYRKTAWRVAASIALVIALGATYYFNSRKTDKEPIAAIQVKNVSDIAPGKEGAILTMDDGRKIVLDSLGNGVVAKEDGLSILLTNGELKYQANDGTAAVVYNTVSTPKGRQFRLQLSDGTKVWLNAASSIRYPATFTNERREVKVEGEVYFEVAKQVDGNGNRIPFDVMINETTKVEVLGTHFNINAYKDEATINTTLLEGAVRISNGNTFQQIKPGQQARVSNSNASAPINVLSNVSIDKVMAWKNGLFDFQDATLEEVMRQLERWYDIDVVYEKNIPKLEFFGKMGKDLTLATVLRGLEKSNVHFRIEGERKLVVLP